MEDSLEFLSTAQLARLELSLGEVFLPAARAGRYFRESPGKTPKTEIKVLPALIHLIQKSNMLLKPSKE